MAERGLRVVEMASVVLDGVLPLDQNPAAVYLAGLGEGSRRTMRQALEMIARLVDKEADALTFPWSALRFQHTTAVRAKLEKRYASATANKMLSALRGTLKAAWRLGQMSGEDYHLAVSVESIKGKALPAGRSVTSGELAALMDACAADPGPAGARDAAMVALLYACGLRREELVALDVVDYDPEAKTLRVRGKRNKERMTYVFGGAAEALADWLVVRKRRAGPLFLPIHKGGDVQRRRLSTQAVYYVLQTRAAQAGVKKLSPHDFRRTFVGDLLEAGADIVTVQTQRALARAGGAYYGRAVETLRLLSGAMARYPRAFGQALSALDAYLSTTKEIVIVGDPQGAATQALLETVHARYLPNKVLVVAGPDQVDELSQRIPLLTGRTQIDGAATAYVCENYACQLPVTEPEALRAQLEQR